MPFAIKMLERKELFEFYKFFARLMANRKGFEQQSRFREQNGQTKADALQTF